MPTETIEEIETLDLPELSELNAVEDVRAGADIGGPWIVILYNCDCHTFDDVIGILMQATGCTAAQGQKIAEEVDSKGRAICFSGSQPECDRVAGIIGSIRLQVETDRA